MFGMGIVLLVNCILMAVLIVELRSARTQANHIQTQVAPVIQTMNTVASVVDLGSRALHGNVFDAVNSLLQTNFQAVASDVYRTADKIEKAFDMDPYPNPNSAGFMSVAQYSSLVRSIASAVQGLTPKFPSPAPIDPDGDGGLLDVLTYITTWADSQTNVTSIRSLAQTCDIVLDAALSLNWSGCYSWGSANTAVWDASSAKPTVTKIQQYCEQVSKMTSQMKSHRFD